MIFDDQCFLSDLWWPIFCLWSWTTDLLLLMFVVRPLIFDLWWTKFCFRPLMTNVWSLTFDDRSCVSDLWWPIFCCWSLITNFPLLIFTDQPCVLHLWWPIFRYWFLMADFFFLTFDGRTFISNFACQIFPCSLCLMAAVLCLIFHHRPLISKLRLLIFNDRSFNSELWWPIFSIQYWMTNLVCVVVGGRYF